MQFLRPYLWVTILLLLCLTACVKVNDLFSPPNDRELYKRSLEGDTFGFARWEAAFHAGLMDSLLVELPYQEVGVMDGQKLPVYSYSIMLQEGERLVLEMQTDTTDPRIFIDFFERGIDTLSSLGKAGPYDRFFHYDAEKTGMFKILLQPEMDARSAFSFVFYTLPRYAFPVAGAGNSDIHSFWGAARDGGRRIHEGIDIFARRGTPVVAATEGRVSFAGERGLGGKQVWLRTGLFGKSLYYAHLDSISASMDQRVAPGDTLGFVGNSGNASTTSPHLHFGIYGRGGAVDPLPFVFRSPHSELPPLEVKIPSTGVVKSAKANLRMHNSTSGDPIGQAESGDSLQLLGQSGEWYHVKTKESARAYVHSSLVH